DLEVVQRAAEERGVVDLPGLAGLVLVEAVRAGGLQLLDVRADALVRGREALLRGEDLAAEGVLGRATGGGRARDEEGQDGDGHGEAGTTDDGSDHASSRCTGGVDGAGSSPLYRARPAGSP